jgi:hypothetical protein
LIAQARELRSVAASVWRWRSVIDSIVLRSDIAMLTRNLRQRV